MTQSSNPSLIVEPEVPPTQGALPVWTKVFTKPGEKTFLEITGHPEAKARSAYLWVFLVGTLTGLIGGLTQFIAALVGLRSAVPEIGQISGFSGIFGTAGLIGAICGAPLAGLFSLIGFVLGVAILHATAKFLGGQGTFDQMAYAFGAVVAPLSLVTGLLVPFNLIPFAALCTLPLFLLLGLYAIYLEVAATKAIHKFGWGGAAAAFFLPAILIGLLCGVISLGLLKIAGPSLNGIFGQMRPGL
ncbi:MAG: YIP1 family protein [Bacteroidota bacterium]